MKTAAQLSARQRNRLKRRNLILDAAARLFAERGFHRVTTKEIAAAAGIAEGTIYNYFHSKDEILVGFLVRMTEEMEVEGVLAQALDTPLRVFLLKILDFQRTLMSQHGYMLKAIMSEILANRELGEQYYAQIATPTLTYFEKHLQQRIAAGQIKEMDVSVTARVITAMLSGMLLLQMVGDPVLLHQTETFSEALVDTILDTILVAEASDLASIPLPTAGKPGV